MTAIMVAMAAPPVSAASLGASDRAAVLGQWLDFAVPVRLDPAESLEPECVHAEVTVGERRLPSPLVRTVVEAQGAGNARIRVIAAQAIDEPVIGVDLRIGCPVRLSRSYVVLADPPEMATSATVAFVSAPAHAATPADAEVAAASPLLLPEPPQAVPLRSDGPGFAAGAVAAGSLAAAPAPARRAQARSATVTAARAAAPPQRRSRPRSTVPRARPRMPALRVAAVAAAPAPARLMLEVAEVTPSAEAATVQMAMEAVSQAASAVRASEAAASAAAARIATLERTAERLGQEVRSSRDEASRLREQLERVDDAGRWLLPLSALAAGLAALAAWLVWRLSGLQRRHRGQQGWVDATAQPSGSLPAGDSMASRPPTSPTPFVTSGLHGSDGAAARQRVRGAAAWPPAAPPETGATAGAWPPSPEPAETPADRAMMRTEVLPPSVRLGDSSPRDVSIEELIDLEQQAEFFVVLGQDEAAIDLLVQHLRDTGGGSPLPYLKLLEIQHRRGDRDAYERTRARFNHRFNAYAPEWGQDMRAGRSLQDYPGVLPRLQQVWSRPLDAMAELEALLFRKSRGELFDLPAYREVLFLYALARDLLDREPVDLHSVDLLLPLADGTEFSTTAPAPLRGTERQEGDGAPPEAEDRLTAAVDLDLTQAAPAPSIFDSHDRPPPATRP